MLEYNGHKVLEEAQFDLDEIKYLKEDEPFKDWTDEQLLTYYLKDYIYDAFTISDWGEVEEDCIYFQFNNDIWKWIIEEDEVCEITNEHRIMYYSQTFEKMS